ncbi:MAG: hypothetical protein JWN53_624, partial [Gemmatimonadetes bacterium]|nr:hypothetical protein [Gemmatimonadota bacterium]
MALTALSASRSPAAAQQDSTRRAPSGRLTVPCAGQRIDDIVIYSAAPTVANLRRFPMLASAARTFHITTRTEVIRRFLLLRSGEPCNDLWRAESERILRAQPYIADADIYAISNDVGGVDLEVRTSDEMSIVLGAGLRSGAPTVRAARFGNANVGGEGIYAAAGWRYGDMFRSGFTGRVTDNQFLGHPWTVGVEGERAPLGGTWRVDAAHSFLTDEQRVAWRVRAGSSDSYVELRRPDGSRPSIALDRDFYDVGAIGRVGPPGHFALFGLSLTGEGSRPGSRLLTADTGVVTDVGTSPITYLAHRIGRVNALLGLRQINFVRVDGLDALTAAQDVPTGFQLGTQIGRSAPLLGGEDADVSIAGDLYLGTIRGRSTFRLQLQGEGRRALGQSAWDDVLTTGRATQYFQRTPSHLHQTVLEWSGGYRQRVPFQLLLGIPNGGVRGYEEASFAGARRLVVRSEERWSFANVDQLADAGVALFADVGRQWAGDAPYGVT